MSNSRFFDAHSTIKLRGNISAPEDAVNVQWVQDYVEGKVKMPVRAVSAVDITGTYNPADLTLTITATGELTIDSIALSDGDRILLARQADATQNGVYSVTNAGSAGTQAVLTRASDFDSSGDIFTGVTVAVNEGALYAGTKWRLMTMGTIILDSTALEWEQVAATVTPSKYVEVIVGDSSKTEFEIEHNLGTTDIIVQVYNKHLRKIKKK